MKCSEYIKSRGLKDLRTFATLVSGVEKDLSLERKLLRWYETNREMFDCLILGAIERRAYKYSNSKTRGADV